MAITSKRSYTWNAFETTLNGAIDGTTSNIVLTSVTGLRQPSGYLVIDPDTAANREYVKYATISGSTLQGVTRGLAGGQTNQSHSSGAVVRAVAMHQQFDDLWDTIEDLDDWADQHLIAADPHASAGYLQVADTNALYLALAGGTMTGNLDMNSNNITNVADPAGADGAMPRSYADARYVEIAGDTMTGQLDINTGAGTAGLDMLDARIINVGDPSANHNAMPRSYADDRYAPIVRDVRHLVREQGTGSIGTSDGVVANFTTIGMPSGWTTAEVTIRASVQFSNFSGGNVAAVYLRGDGNDGTSRNTSSVAAGENGPPVELVLQYTTSQANIDIDVRGSLDSGTATYKYANALILLRRTV